MKKHLLWILPIAVLVIALVFYCLDGSKPPQINDEWGIALRVKKVSPTEMTLVICRDGSMQGAYTRFSVGADYRIDVKKDGIWEEYPVISDMGFTGEAYSIEEGISKSMKFNWETRYGILPNGSYRLVKTIMKTRVPGDNELREYYAEFKID